jgi:hypothetical protein
VIAALHQKWLCTIESQVSDIFGHSVLAIVSRNTKISPKARFHLGSDVNARLDKLPVPVGIGH